MTKDITQSINHDYTMESQVDMHEYGGVTDQQPQKGRKAADLRTFIARSTQPE